MPRALKADEEVIPMPQASARPLAPGEDVISQIGQPSAPQTVSPPDISVVPAEGINKLAAAPMAALDPYTGGWASTLGPTTPAQWGALAGLSLAAPFTGGTSLAPWMVRAGMAGLGAGTGAFMGGATPAQALAQGALTGGVQLGVEGLAKGIGKGAELGGRILSTTTNPYWRGIANAVGNIIPGVRTDNPNSTWFINVFRGGEGQKALSTAMREGLDSIKQRLPENFFIQSKLLTDIVTENKKNLISAPEALDLRTAGEILAKAGLKMPGKVLESRGQPMTFEMATKLASQLSEYARGLEGSERQAANILVQRFRGELARQLGDQLGGEYQGLIKNYWMGKSILDAVAEDGDKIFKQGGKIDTPALGYAINNKALAKMREIPGGAEFAAATARGAPPGQGDIHHRIPFSAYLFGHTRVADPGLQLTIPAGAPGVGSRFMGSPYLYGIPAGQATTGPGSRFIDTLFPPEEQK